LFLQKQSSYRSPAKKIFKVDEADNTPRTFWLAKGEVGGGWDFPLGGKKDASQSS
jgi:hypothetical protein